mmetsp:Transcript_122990/g.244765  ORF Transcript_122990/g.244765 Transcript_122990/m.244765 type:complete len:203 (-) Transcript_122990:1101-1709(-)
MQRSLFSVVAAKEARLKPAKKMEVTHANCIMSPTTILHTMTTRCPVLLKPRRNHSKYDQQNSAPNASPVSAHGEPHMSRNCDAMKLLQKPRLMTFSKKAAPSNWKWPRKPSELSSRNSTYSFLIARKKTTHLLKECTHACFQLASSLSPPHGMGKMTIMLNANACNIANSNRSMKRVLAKLSHFFVSNSWIRGSINKSKWPS